MGVPSYCKVQTFEEFDKCLCEAMSAMASLVADCPEDRMLLSVKMQLEALNAWTRGGAAPTQAQKDSINFGQIASRCISEIDDDLAQNLYALATYVTYWNQA